MVTDDDNQNVKRVEQEEGVNSSDQVSESALRTPVSLDTPKLDSNWEEFKVTAVVGYVFPFLFFLPLVDREARSSQYARFHANQQLNILVAAFILYIISTVVTVILYGLGVGVYILALLQLTPLILVGLAIVGVINAVKGRMKRLPVVGRYQFLK